MGPHPDHFDDALRVQDLVHQPMLNVDPARTGAREIANEFLETRRRLSRILPQNLEKLLGLLLEPAAREFAGVSLRLTRKDQAPGTRAALQPGFAKVLERGVASPWRIDSRMPGIESRYSVSSIACQSSSEISTPLCRLPVIWIGRCVFAVSSSRR